MNISHTVLNLIRNENMLKKYINNLDRAKELVTLRKEKLDNFILPFLKELGIKNVFIESVYYDTDNTVNIEYGWSCRGECSYKTLILPKYIFDSVDPIKETKLYIEKINDQKIKNELEIKKRKLLALQQEISSLSSKV